MKNIILSLKEGIKILELNKMTINLLKYQKKLEDIFLENLIVNYFLCMVLFFIFLGFGDYRVGNTIINSSFFLGFLLLYPFLYNLFIYIVYLIFGISAEFIDNKKNIRPLMTIGYHTSIIYSFIFFFLALAFVYNKIVGLILLLIYLSYFLINMFCVISEVYHFSLHKTLIVLFVPILCISILFLFIAIFFPQVFYLLFRFF